MDLMQFSSIIFGINAIREVDKRLYHDGISNRYKLITKMYEELTNIDQFVTKKIEYV